MAQRFRVRLKDGTYIGKPEGRDKDQLPGTGRPYIKTNHKSAHLFKTEQEGQAVADEFFPDDKVSQFREAIVPNSEDH